MMTGSCHSDFKVTMVPANMLVFGKQQCKFYNRCCIQQAEMQAQCQAGAHLKSELLLNSGAGRQSTVNDSLHSVSRHASPFCRMFVVL